MRVAQGEGAAIEDALDAASAIEILHNYSLVHDDIEDRDELRHGRQTLWSRNGIAQAINAGDAMCALSFLTLVRAQQRHDGDRVVAMVRVLHEAHRVMCNGQSLDLAFESESYVERADYEEMIACKTAALFEAACVLGAHSAGASDSTIAEYAAIGRSYGMAFQIVDDVHGIWSSAQMTGKVAGNDIARRKWTFPVVWALAQPESSARTAVADAYALGRTLEAGEIERVVSALDALGAAGAARMAIETYRAPIERAANRDLRDFLLATL